MPNENVIEAGRNGEWIPLEQFHALALAAVDQKDTVTINLAGIDHLDGGALQLIVALTNERARRGYTLQLANPSPALAQSFGYAGASEYLSPHEPASAHERA